MDSHQEEAREERDLGCFELAPDPLPAEVERDGSPEQESLDPGEGSGAESESGEGAGESRTLLFHEEEEQERGREQELDDDLGVGETGEPDLDLENREKRGREGGDLEAEDPPECEKETRDREEGEERRRIEAGFGLIERRGGPDPDWVEVESVRDDPGAFRRLQAKSQVPMVIPGWKHLVREEERPSFPGYVRHDRVVVDESPVSSEVEAGVHVHAGVAPAEDVLERREVDRGGECDQGGCDEHLGPRHGSGPKGKAASQNHDGERSAGDDDERGARGGEEAELRENERHPPGDEEASRGRKVYLLHKAQPQLALAAERRDQHQAREEKDRESGEGCGEGGHVGKSSRRRPS